MNASEVSIHRPQMGNRVQPTGRVLPEWQQVSLEHKRELMTTLAAMIVKQLPLPPKGQKEQANERPA
jgi:hypothetical protein